MKEIEGDLIAMAKDGELDVIVQGCNCFCSMEAGIAKIIAREFPSAAEADRQTEEGDRDKLGTFTSAEETIGDHRLTIVNAYTQYGYKSGGKRLVHYEAISSCFEQIAKEFGGMRIGYPMIGAGMAGGDWEKIAKRIDAALEGCDHTLVTLPETGSS